MKALRVERMRGIFNGDLIEKLLFSAVVIGIALAAFAGWRYVDISNQLAGNMAARIHDDGGEVALESKAQAHNLMASDLARRRLHSEQFTMMIVGGAGLALLGLGWLGYDIMRARRRKKAGEIPASPSAG